MGDAPSVRLLPGALAATLLVAAGSWGQEPRRICDPDDPASRCPGDRCSCSDDRLRVLFDATGESSILLDPLEAGAVVDVTFALDVSSPSIEGWSFGVSHPEGFLALESVTVEGTDADRDFGFVFFRWEGLRECGDDPRCPDPVPAAGFITAVPLCLCFAQLLPGRRSVCKARYRVEPPALEQAVAVLPIEIRGNLANPNSPPVSIALTVEGRTKIPTFVTDGRITGRTGRLFRRGDPGGDGRVDVGDEVSLLLFLYLSGPAPRCLEAGDVDDDGRIDSSDPILLLRWLFLQGAPPAPPAPPDCGRDPGEGLLGCAGYAGC